MNLVDLYRRGKLITESKELEKLKRERAVIIRRMSRQQLLEHIVRTELWDRGARGGK